jgi:hypothetical protein
MQFQHQVRKNNQEVNEFLADLYQWEEKVNQGAARPLKANTNDEFGIRNQDQKEPQQTKKSALCGELKRDANTIGSYYKAWDQFDVVG